MPESGGVFKLTRARITFTVTLLAELLMRSIISSRDFSSTLIPLTSISLSPGSRPVSLLCCTRAPGSANITGLICVTPFAVRSTITARRREKPKSFRGGGCLCIVSSRGSGSSSGTISGSCSSIPCSSNETDDRHREKPWDSPTGDRLNGGVAKLEFVVSVKESADGLALVTICMYSGRSFFRYRAIKHFDRCGRYFGNRSSREMNFESQFIREIRRLSL